MKKLLLIVLLFCGSLVCIFAEQAEVINAAPPTSTAEPLYDGPSDHLLMPGFGDGFNAMFFEDMAGTVYDAIYYLYFNVSLNHRMQFGDFAAFDTTVDYHVLIEVDDYSSGYSLAFDDYATISPIFLTHFYHNESTRKFFGSQAIGSMGLFSGFEINDPQKRTRFDVKTLNTASLRLGTSLFLGLEGIHINPSKGLLIGVEYRSLAQAAYKLDSGRKLFFQDFFTLYADGIINYPTNGDFAVTDCLGFDVGVAYTMFDCVFKIHFSMSSYAEALLMHNVYIETVTQFPIRL